MLKNLRIYQLRMLLAETEALERIVPKGESSPFAQIRSELLEAIEELENKERFRLRRMLFDIVFDALTYTPPDSISMDDILEAITRAHTNENPSKYDVWSLSEFLKERGYRLYPEKRVQ